MEASVTCPSPHRPLGTQRETSMWGEGRGEGLCCSPSPQPSPPQLLLFSHSQRSRGRGGKRFSELSICLMFWGRLRRAGELPQVARMVTLKQRLGVWQSATIHSPVHRGDHR